MKDYLLYIDPDTEGNIEIVKLLLEKGADVNAKNENNEF